MYGHPSMLLVHARSLSPSGRAFSRWLSSLQRDLFEEVRHV